MLQNGEISYHELQVLTAKARGAVGGCFREPKMALCGNGVVEEGEECDCGWEEDCEERCCWPQRTEFGEGEKPCTLRPGKACSPTQARISPAFKDPLVEILHKR